MSTSSFTGQEAQFVESVFCPTREISVLGSSVRDILHLIGCALGSAHDSGHQSVAVFTNSRFAYNALSFWCQSWISLAGDDGIWFDSSGRQVPHQSLLETILEFQEQLEIQFFLVSPVLDATE